MKVSDIRQKLHSYLEEADDKKVKALYELMEEEIENASIDYTDDFKKELDKRYESYKANPASAIPEQENRKRINSILSSGK